MPVVTRPLRPAAEPPPVSWWGRWVSWWRGEVATDLGDPVALRAGPGASAPAAVGSVARSVAARGEEARFVAPSLDATFQIQCLPLQDPVELEARIEAECRRRAGSGLSLASTFRHDGHAFLVFKRF